MIELLPHEHKTVEQLRDLLQSSLDRIGPCDTQKARVSILGSIIDRMEIGAIRAIQKGSNPSTVTEANRRFKMIAECVLDELLEGHPHIAS